MTFQETSEASARLGAQIEKASRVLGILLSGLVIVYAYAVVTAPVDAVQGVIQKILYVHPPLAYGAYLGFILTAIGGAIYIAKGSEPADRLAIAGAEVGLIFCTLMMITGPIWGKGTWGQWWSWDPRLTVTLLLWFIYLAYLLLRSFSEPGPRASRFAAIYGILGTLLIPLNYYVIELFGNRSMHPENLKQGSLGEGMVFPFVMANLALATAFFYLLVQRWGVENLRAEVALQAIREESEQ